MKILKSALLRSDNNGLILEENIKTLLQEDCEILVIDDASRDPYTVKIIRRYVHPKYFGKITIWRHRKPYGPANNWNYLTRRAKGKYFLFLSPEVLYIPNSFDYLIKRLENHSTNHNIRAVGFRFDYYTHSREEVLPSNLKEDIPLEIPEYFYAPLHYGVFDRKVFYYYKLKFETDYGIGVGFEDWDFGLRMLRYNIKSALLPIKFYSDFKSHNWWNKHPPEKLRLKERYDTFVKIWGPNLSYLIKIDQVFQTYNLQDNAFALMLLETRNEDKLKEFSDEVKNKVKEFWAILDIYQQKNPTKYQIKKEEFVKKLTQILYGLQ